MRKMLFRALILLLLLAGSYLLTRAMFLDSGYVLVAYNGYTLEGSLWAMVLALVIALVLVRLGFYLLQLITGQAELVLPLSARARRRRSQRLSNKGLIQFANGHWRSAQRLLGVSAKSGSLPLLNYLVAARAASANNDLESSKEFLRKADQQAPAAYMAIGITQAEIQLSHNQLEQALATLKSLRKRSPKHIYVLKLLKQTYEKLEDWYALAQLLPMLKKLKVLDTDVQEQLEQNIYYALFEQAWQKGKNLQDNPTQPADEIWNSFSKAQRRSEELVWRYANCLYRLGAEEQAEAFIRRQLPSIFSARLIRIYGRLRCSDTNRQLLSAEKLLAERPNDADLLLALGRICSRNQLWGKARDYLETSLSLRRSVDGFNELGLLLAQRGEHELSSGYFQKGLAMAAE